MTQNSNSQQTETIGTFEMVSYGYSENHDGPTGEKTITCWERSGSPDDPYGGWAEVESFFGLTTIVLEGETVPDATTGSVGHGDGRLYEVRKVDGKAEIVAT